MFAADMLPEKSALPCTANVIEGVVVPTPMRPFWIPPTPSDSLYTVRSGVPSICAE